MRRTLRLRLLLLLAVTATTTPRPAHATRWIVDAAGGGDFTTLQAALEAGGRDSILVVPGAYPETLRITVPGSTTHLVGLGKPGDVTVGSIVSTGTQTGGQIVATRLRVLGPVTLSNAYTLSFEQCEFGSEVTSHANHGGANFADCTFRGRTRLIDYSSHGRFRQLRFLAAPLYLETSATGPSSFLDCDFIGPADTLVTARLSPGDNAVSFQDSRFSSARVGVAVTESYANTVGFQGCSLVHLSDAAITYEERQPPANCSFCTQTLSLQVASCHLAHVGTGIRWRTWWPSRIELDSVSIRHAAGDAIRATLGGSPPPANPTLRKVHVEDCRGSGLVIERAIHDAQFMSFWIDSSRFTRCGGDGVRVDASPQHGDLWLSRITSSLSDHNAGAGFTLGRSGTALLGNIAFANGSHGIALMAETHNLDRADSVLSNTAVGNGGDGIRVQRFGAGLAQPQLVERNIAALNGQTGIRVTHPSTPRDNVAWHNYLSDFVGFEAWLDSNRVADPRFCDLSADDFTLQADSPCAPSAAHDLIGALPVACASTVHSDGPRPGSSFALWPNPSRGPVRFALPARASGRVEIHDLFGRLIWARPVRPGETLLWDGTSNGRAAPGGVYQARLVGPQGTRSVRFVRLR